MAFNKKKSQIDFSLPVCFKDSIYEEISEEPLDELSDNLSEILEIETTDDETEKSVNSFNRKEFEKKYGLD